MARRVKDGQHIGRRHTVTARQVAEILGLKPEPPAPKTPPLSPAQARAKSEGRPLPPGDETLEIVTVPAGREVLDLWGGDSVELPVGVEETLDAPKPKREGRPESTAMNAPSPEEAAAEAAEELRAVAREHAQRQKARMEWAIANGTPEQKQAAAVEAQDTASLIRRVHERLSSS